MTTHRLVVLRQAVAEMTHPLPPHWRQRNAYVEAHQRMHPKLQERYDRLKQEMLDRLIQGVWSSTTINLPTEQECWYFGIDKHQLKAVFALIYG